MSIAFFVQYLITKFQVIPIRMIAIKIIILLNICIIYVSFCFIFVKLQLARPELCLCPCWQADMYSKWQFFIVFRNASAFGNKTMPKTCSWGIHLHYSHDKFPLKAILFQLSLLWVLRCIVTTSQKFQWKLNIEIHNCWKWESENI